MKGPRLEPIEFDPLVSCAYQSTKVKGDLSHYDGNFFIKVPCGRIVAVDDSWGHLARPVWNRKLGPTGQVVEAVGHYEAWHNKHGGTLRFVESFVGVEKGDGLEH